MSRRFPILNKRKQFIDGSKKRENSHRFTYRHLLIKKNNNNNENVVPGNILLCFDSEFDIVNFLFYEERTRDGVCSSKIYVLQWLSARYCLATLKTQHKK